VNAVDNSQRIGRGIQMTYIDISIDRRVDKLIISIKNDGKGIPIKIHDDEKIYIPELIFGHLLTGSNFNDDEVR
jgi:DNA topoisomerase-2